MMSIGEIKNILKRMLTHRRYEHSVKVMEAAVMLAEKYGEDVEKAAVAGLVHDCAKDLKDGEVFELCEKYGITTDKIMRSQPELLHGPVGAFLARDLFGIDCPRVLDAISVHTMGRRGMDKLGSIIFIADYIEENRDYPGVGVIRTAAEESLEKAIIAGIDNTIRHVLDKGRLLHPQTVDTRNWALEKLTERNAGKLMEEG
ncbi:MAG: bis(5'-nucleosyl)-tetraphosphatase (symmetrical) YqeK [Bacillota bacterium]